MTRTKILLLTLLALLPLAWGLAFQPSPTDLWLNLTPSLQRGVYKVVPFDGNLMAGDYVIVSVPDNARELVYGRRWLPADWPLLKRVAGLPGDSYAINNAGQFCVNGFPLGAVSDLDSSGLPLPRLTPGIVPEGHFLLFADKIPNSFDSRYLGPIPNKLILKKVVPILTYP